MELSGRPPRPVDAADAVMNSLVLFASTIFLRVVIRGFSLFGLAPLLFCLLFSFSFVYIKSISVLHLFNVWCALTLDKIGV